MSNEFKLHFPQQPLFLPLSAELREKLYLTQIFDQVQPHGLLDSYQEFEYKVQVLSILIKKFQQLTLEINLNPSLNTELEVYKDLKRSSPIPNQLITALINKGFFTTGYIKMKVSNSLSSLSIDLLNFNSLLIDINFKINFLALILYLKSLDFSGDNINKYKELTIYSQTNNLTKFNLIDLYNLIREVLEQNISDFVFTQKIRKALDEKLIEMFGMSNIVFSFVFGDIENKKSNRFELPLNIKQMDSGSYSILDILFLFIILLEGLVNNSDFTIDIFEK